MKGKVDTNINFTGYRINIDKFFVERLHDPKFPCPLKQEMPARLVEIIDWLAKCSTVGRSKVAGYLLDLSGDERKRLTDCIEGELKAQPTRGRPLAYSVAGGNLIGYTVFCYMDTWAPRKADIALSHAKQAMVIAQQSNRLLLELSFTDQGVLRDVNWTWIDEASISADEMAALKVQADKLRQARLRRASEMRGKIGRNDPCPCGSGKKYKKCCLR